MTHRLIEQVFRPAFATTPEDLTHDGAALEIAGARIAFTTDSYVVRPLFFPGGDIGTLAVNGTVNDLAMCGAEPLYLSVGMVIEEGLAVADLRRVVASMRDAALAAGVRLVTGDTKVVEHGKGDGLYVNTSGIGRCLTPEPVAPRRIRAGDAILLSGDIGRHGIAVMAAREGLGFETPVLSDCAPLAAAVARLIAAGIELHCLRDLTRGGLATALIEIAETAGMALWIRCAAPARSSASIRTTWRTREGSSPSCRRRTPSGASPCCVHSTRTPPRSAGSNRRAIRAPSPSTRSAEPVRSTCSAASNCRASAEALTTGRATHVHRPQRQSA
jgi:hydrogenase expression/formation protein HypE